MAFIRIARLDEVQPGFRRLVRAGRHEILALEHEGQLHLVSNQCPHQGFPLARADVSGHSLVCPRHGFRFNLSTGECFQAACVLPRYKTAWDGQWVGVDLAE